MMNPNFDDLRDLHKCANDLLLSPMIQQDTSALQDMAETVLEMLDLCGATRDVLLLAKEHLHHLQSAARRTTVSHSEDSNSEAQMSARNIEKKKLKKEMAKCLGSLKDVKKYNKYFFTSDLSLIDSNLIVVVHVLREVRVAAISILESLLPVISTHSTISLNSGRRTGRGPSLAMRIGQRLFEKRESSARVYDLGRMETVVEAVEGKPLEVLEVEMECIIRRLIHTRVLLLNILNR